jgi:hypothetical protein
VDGEKSHLFSLGYGFIYSTRFCFLSGGNYSFSKTFMTELLNGTTTRVENIENDTLFDVQNKLRDTFGYYKQL